MRAPLLAISNQEMPRRQPTNGRKKATGEGEQITLWPGVAPVTAYDLAVWVWGVSHVRPGQRGFLAHCHSFRIVDKIAGSKHELARWREYEKAAHGRAALELGLPGDQAMRICADIMLAYLAEFALM